MLKMNKFLKLIVTFLLAFLAFNIFFSSFRNHRRWENIFADVQCERKKKCKRKPFEDERKYKIPIKKESDEEETIEEEENLDKLLLPAATLLLAAALFFFLRYLACLGAQHLLRNGSIELLTKYDASSLNLEEFKERLSSMKKIYNDENNRRYVGKEVIEIFVAIYNQVEAPGLFAGISFLLTLVFLSLILSSVITSYPFNFYRSRWRSIRKHQKNKHQKNKHQKGSKFSIILSIVFIIIIVVVVSSIIWFKFKYKEDCCKEGDKNSFPFIFKDKKYVDLSDSDAVSFEEFARFNRAYAEMKKIFEDVIDDDFDHFYQQHFEHNKELVNLYEERKKKEKKITNLDQLIEMNGKKKILMEKLELRRKKKKLEFLLRECEAEKKKIEEEIRNVYKEFPDLNAQNQNKEEKVDGILKDLGDKIEYKKEELGLGYEEKKKKYKDLLYSYKYVQKGIELAKIWIDIFTGNLCDLDNGEDDEYNPFDLLDIDDFLKSLSQKGIFLTEIYPKDLKDDPNGMSADGIIEINNNFNNFNALGKADDVGSYFKKNDAKCKLILQSVRIQNLQEEKDKLLEDLNNSCSDNFESRFKSNNPLEEKNRLVNRVGKDKVKRYFEIKKEMRESKQKYLDDLINFLAKGQNVGFNDKVRQSFQSRNPMDINKIVDFSNEFREATEKIKNIKGTESYKNKLKYVKDDKSGRLSELLDLGDEPFMIAFGDNTFDDQADQVDKKLNEEGKGLFDFRRFLFLAKVNPGDPNDLNRFEFIFSENEFLGSEVLFEKIAQTLLTRKIIETNNNFLRKDKDKNEINNENDENEGEEGEEGEENKDKKDKKEDGKNNLEKIIEMANYKEGGDEFARNEELSDSDLQEDKNIELSNKYSKYKKEIADLDRDFLFLNRRIRTAFLASKENKNRELWEAYQDKKNTEKALTETMKKYSLEKLKGNFENQQRARSYYQEKKAEEAPNKDEGEKTDAQIYEAYKYLEKDFSPEKKEYFVEMRLDASIENLNYYQQVADNYYSLRERIYNYQKQHPGNNVKNDDDKLLELSKRKDKVKEKMKKIVSAVKTRFFIDKLKEKHSNSAKLETEYPKIEKILGMSYWMPKNNLPELASKRSQLSKEIAIQRRINLKKIDEELKEKKVLFQKCLESIKSDIDILNKKENDGDNNIFNEDNNELDIREISKGDNEKNLIENIASRYFLKVSPDAASSFAEGEAAQKYLKTVDENERLQKKREKILTCQLADAAQELEFIRSYYMEDFVNEDFSTGKQKLMRRDFYKKNNNDDDNVISTDSKCSIKKEKVGTTDIVIASQRNRKEKERKQQLLPKGSEFTGFFPRTLEDNYFSTVDEFGIAQTLLGITTMTADDNNDQKLNQILKRLPLKEKKNYERKKIELKKIHQENYLSKDMKTIDDDELEKMFIKEEEKKIVRDYQRSSKKLEDIRKNIRDAKLEYSSRNNRKEDDNQKIYLQVIDIIEEEMKKLEADFNVREDDGYEIVNS